jgi:hypothetical protein
MNRLPEQTKKCCAPTAAIGRKRINIPSSLILFLFFCSRGFFFLVLSPVNFQSFPMHHQSSARSPRKPKLNRAASFLASRR